MRHPFLQYTQFGTRSPHLFKFSEKASTPALLVEKLSAALQPHEPSPKGAHRNVQQLKHRTDMNTRI